MFGNQTCSRPIIVGAAIGAACGDLKTGVIMGAELEAIYMGVSAFGGVMASDYTVSAAIGTALVCSGVDMETGLALSAPIGIIINTLKPIEKTVMDMLTPIYQKYQKQGEYGKFHALLWIQGEVFQEAFECLLLFLGVYFGTDALQSVISVLPQFVLTGLNTAGSMLVVVGLAILTQSIWTPTTPVWVILGFVLFKYLGFTNTTCAVLGTCVAVIAFKLNKQFKDVKAAPVVAAENNGGDDFYE